MADNQLNEKSIEKRLMSFSNTQDSVQAMSLWIMHNRSQHQKIVNTWMKVLRKSDPKHKLTLFYLCNDVVQHAKRKKALYYLENFKDNLREAVHIIRELDKIKPSVNRIFKIWEERRTYDAKFINELRKILESEASGGSSASVTPVATASPVVSYKPSKKSDSRESRKAEHRKEREKKREEMEKKKEEQIKEEKPKDKPVDVAKEAKEAKKEPTVPSEFKTSLFIEEMTNLRQLDSEANLKAKQLAAMRIDATNMEAVKQLKDRSHGNEFCKQFEESCVKIEDYVEMLEKEISQRRTVLAMCEDAEAFYDEQYSEAKIVATAYKNFGARVTNMKKRVDDMKKIIPSTPSPVPSPTADAPSPGGTPPLQDMDDNDTVDMELEEDSGPNKIQESDGQPQPRGAYTAMVKSIPQPISSVTDITMQDNKNSDEPIEISPVKEETPPPPFKSVTDTFQGSNILESRIASMLPNLAKGASNLGPQAPVLTGLQDDSRSRDTTPDFVPPKPDREESSDDRSSTPVMDEPEEKEPTPTKPQPSTKPPTTKVKTNPIDFLSQLLTKTSNSSSSSNFLQSLSLLTNTVKSQYQKQQESSSSEETTKVTAPPPVSTDTVDSNIPSSLDSRISTMKPAAVSSFTGVPPPEPISQTSSWSGWKPVVTPPQPPLLKPQPPSPPVLPGVKSPEGLNHPPLPQHPPPLPPEPFPVQPPSPQTFPRPPPPVSQTYLPVTSVSQPYGPPRPTLQPFSQAAAPPVFPSVPVNSQAYLNPASHPSSSPVTVMPPRVVRTGFNPQFPYGVPPEPRPVAPRPPPPPLMAQTITLAPRPPSPYIQQQPRPWLQQTNLPPDIRPPISQSAFPPPPPPTDTSVPPPPPWQREVPHSSQPPAPVYGNVIHTLSSNRPDWESQGDAGFGQRRISEEEESWNQQQEAEPEWNQPEPDSEVDGGYAHPWDQPKNFEADDDEEEEDEDDLEIIETNPEVQQALPPPTPKSILRHRSSLREVVLVDDSSGNNVGNIGVAPPGDKPAGVLRKPPIDTGGPKGDNVGDVQSEFIAKLKQKSGGATHMPVPPPASRTLTPVSMDAGGHVSGASAGHSISTIGVISSNGRTSSVKSDDMELDSDEHDSNASAAVEQSQWEGSSEHGWRDGEQGLVMRDYSRDMPLEDPSLPPDPYRQPGPDQSQSYDPYSPRGYQPHRPAPRYRDHYRGPPPPKSPMYPPARPRMPYYRY